MSQRDSGYARKERDLYETPAWVTEALLPHIRPRMEVIWEPAAGSGKIATVLQTKYPIVYQWDVEPTPNLNLRCSFLDFGEEPDGYEAIITNPPYELASEFVEQSLRLTEKAAGFVAMLLRTDFDHAKTRSHLFRDCPAFAKKLVLTRRIVWFEPQPGAKGKSPSFNHAWFIWDWRNEGAPKLAYGP